MEAEVTDTSLFAGSFEACLKVADRLARLGIDKHEFSRLLD
jgi:hypothetical protein